MKNGKVTGLSGELLALVKAAGEAGVGMIFDVVNQIMVEGIFQHNIH